MCQTRGAVGAEPLERELRVAVVVRAREDDHRDRRRAPRLVLTRRLQLDLVALDQRVGEELLAHALDLGARLGGVVRLELEVDDACRRAPRPTAKPRWRSELSTA